MRCYAQRSHCEWICDVPVSRFCHGVFGFRMDSLDSLRPIWMVDFRLGRLEMENG